MSTKAVTTKLRLSSVQRCMVTIHVWKGKAAYFFYHRSFLKTYDLTAPPCTYWILIYNNVQISLRWKAVWDYIYSNMLSNKVANIIYHLVHYCLLQYTSVSIEINVLCVISYSNKMLSFMYYSLCTLYFSCNYHIGIRCRLLYIVYQEYSEIYLPTSIII